MDLPEILLTSIRFFIYFYMNIQIGFRQDFNRNAPGFLLEFLQDRVCEGWKSLTPDIDPAR